MVWADWGTRSIRGAQHQEVSHSDKAVESRSCGNYPRLSGWDSGRLRSDTLLQGRGLAEGARPHEGGWSQAGPHLSRSLGKEQVAQAEACQGWSASRGNSGFFPLPHPHWSPDLTQGQPLLPPRRTGAVQRCSEAGEEVVTGLVQVPCPW